MTIQTDAYIEAKLQIEGFHSWPDAPEECRWLRDNHRHIFVIRALKKVFHDDRDVEFILFGRQIEEYLRNTYGNDANRALNFGHRSCEMLAKELIATFGLTRCSVHEDDENGAIVITKEQNQL